MLNLAGRWLLDDPTMSSVSKTGARYKSGPEAEDRVVRVVVAAIHEHRLSPGSRLIERELAEAADAGRMAVRNGLRRLSEAGLVDLSPNRGATVMQWSQGDMEQIFEARIINEEAALLKLAGQMTDDHRVRLETIVREECAAYDEGHIEIARHLSRRFHMTFTELAGNSLIARFVKDLIDCQPLLSSGRAGRASSFSGTAAHIKTLAALVRGDGAEAASVNTALLRSLQSELALDRPRDGKGSKPHS